VTGRVTPRNPTARKRPMTPARMAALVREGKVPAHYAVAKSDGASAVRAWIDLLPEWQSALARRIDAVVTHAMRDAHRAVKWHGAWYGVPGRGWFLAVASFRAHLKLVFFDGASLTPAPPVPLAAKRQRALDLREADALDEARLARWVKQAGRLPGWGRA
jgi:hypothetical protein